MESERICATSSFVWRHADALGCGAFGMVFKGHSKETGEPVAIKTPVVKVSLNGLQHTQEIQHKQHKQEIQLLQSFFHPNIIKLLAVETEHTRNGDGHQVLVLELAECSLHQELERPENFFGLQDSHFLLLLEHIVSGLMYLKNIHGIIHRDLKPSNILKFLDSDGRVVYKLCDFGGARSVNSDSQALYSVVGTEEYIHPAIHASVMMGGEWNEYTTGCDLWSVGVTLYQIATGQLPFLFKDGSRANRLALFELTSTKPKGMISGRKSPSGEVKWSPKLSRSTQLSAILSDLVEELLRGLLECNKNDQWTYERFFLESNKLFQSFKVTRLHYFDAVAAFNIYSCGKSLFDVLKRIIGNTNVNVKEGYIWCSERRQLSSLNSVDEMDSVLPISDAILFFGFSQDFVQKVTLPCALPKIEINDKIVERRERICHQIEMDVSLSKTVAALGHFMYRSAVDTRKCLHQSTVMLTELKSVCELKLTETRRLLIGCRKQMDGVYQQLNVVSECICLSERMKIHLNRNKKSLEQLDRELKECDARLTQLTNAFTIWPIPVITSSSDDQLIAFMKPYLEQLDDIWMHFRKDKSLYGSAFPSHHEHHWHEMTKKRMKHALNAIFEKLNSERMKAKTATVTMSGTVKFLAETIVKLNGSMSTAIRQSSDMIDAFQPSLQRVIDEHFSRDHIEALALDKTVDSVTAEAETVTSSHFSDISSKQLDSLILDAVAFRELTEKLVDLSNRWINAHLNIAQDNS